MDSDQEDSIIDTDEQLSTTGLDKATIDVGSENHPDATMWDRIQSLTCSMKKEFWSKLLAEDETLFRMQFKEYFIEACKTQLYKIHDFTENDQTWNSLMETKSQVFEETSEDDEAFFSAIDKRKYKLLKTIDWTRVEAELADSSDGSDADGEYDVQ